MILLGVDCRDERLRVFFLILQGWESGPYSPWARKEDETLGQTPIRPGRVQHWSGGNCRKEEGRRDRSGFNRFPWRNVVYSDIEGFWLLLLLLFFCDLCRRVYTGKIMHFRAAFGLRNVFTSDRKWEKLETVIRRSSGLRTERRHGDSRHSASVGLSVTLTTIRRIVYSSSRGLSPPPCEPPVNRAHLSCRLEPLTIGADRVTIDLVTGCIHFPACSIDSGKFEHQMRGVDSRPGSPPAKYQDCRSELTMKKTLA